MHALEHTLHLQTYNYQVLENASLIKNISERKIGLITTFQQTFNEFPLEDRCCLDIANQYGRKLVKVIWFTWALGASYMTFSNIESPLNYYLCPVVFLVISAASILFENTCLMGFDRLFNLDNLCLRGLTQRQQLILRSRHRILSQLNCRNRRELEDKYRIFQRFNDPEFLRFSSIIYSLSNDNENRLNEFMESDLLDRRVTTYRFYERSLTDEVRMYFFLAKSPQLIARQIAEYAGPPDSLWNMP